MLSIAVDAMSGEQDPAAAVAASVRMAQVRPDVHFYLSGQEDALAQVLPPKMPPNVSVVAASQIISMEEPPKRAIRRRDSSMRRAIELVANGTAQAVVSAGNTGALLGIGMLEVGAMEGVQRPAIASFMPNPNLPGGCCMLDLGANVDCTPEMLRQFAIMGTALAAAVRGVRKPRVGLLNVGEEHFKGNALLRDAAVLLRDEPSIDFVGNVEGYDIYMGACDVIVCDGFTGNIALKTSEGLARMISGKIKAAFARNWLASLAAIISLPVLRSLRDEMDARKYNGACFLGMRGLVVKSHGNADDTAFYSALDYAVRAGENNVVDMVQAMLHRTSLSAENSEGSETVATDEVQDSKDSKNSKNKIQDDVNKLNSDVNSDVNNAVENAVEDTGTDTVSPDASAATHAN